MKQVLLFLSVIFFFVACKPNIENDANQKLYDEVMVIHDEVMPRMSEIHKLKKKLNKDWKDQNKQSYDEALSLSKALVDADDAMMDWMAEFDLPKDGTDEEVKAYLEEEKNKISAVSTLMNTSIENAEIFINQYK